MFPDPDGVVESHMLVIRVDWKWFRDSNFYLYGWFVSYVT